MAFDDGVEANLGGRMRALPGPREGKRRSKLGPGGNSEARVDEDEPSDGEGSEDDMAECAPEGGRGAKRCGRAATQPTAEDALGAEGRKTRAGINQRFRSCSAGAIILHPDRSN